MAASGSEACPDRASLTGIFALRACAWSGGDGTCRARQGAASPQGLDFRHNGLCALGTIAIGQDDFAAVAVDADCGVAAEAAVAARYDRNARL